MITGTMVNYFTHCKRQCWLFANQINMEDNSEDVRIGKIMHQIKNQGKEEISLEGIKLDKITEDYVVEMKKSDADIEAAIAQLEYYLVVLFDKGIVRKGRLECAETNKTTRSTRILELDDVERLRISNMVLELQGFINREYPPEAVLQKQCKRCSYYEYCFI